MGGRSRPSEVCVLRAFNFGVKYICLCPALYNRQHTAVHSQFNTTSIYRRGQLFRSKRLARLFVDVLRLL